MTEIEPIVDQPLLVDFTLVFFAVIIFRSESSKLSESESDALFVLDLSPIEAVSSAM